MADPHPHHHHHHDPIEDNIDTHPAKLAVSVVVGVVALVIGIILLTQFAVGVYGARSRKDDPAMSDAAVKARLSPVAQVAVDPNAPAAAAAGGAPAAAAPAGAASGAGKSTFDTTCSVCHGTGVAGAPKFGDKAAWAPRLKTGMETLYASAIKGKAAMPAKGGNASLSDADVKAAVDYMATAAKSRLRPARGVLRPALSRNFS